MAINCYLLAVFYRFVLLHVKSTVFNRRSKQKLTAVYSTSFLAVAHREPIWI
ncbi:hypothetical protein M917_1003 [Psychrobacter aquaticus CMS 56]|uniref:Uncharacterized protein n=1 Tax=Psychrobacter aquaticus CMS 56 TaxID=1354303 RepID=U4T5Y1_9GAMM|nr:hypothetical protein M917_1003 [Psychrobacter aquaticus CMS 56]